MSKFYIDHHGHSHFDATPDNREWRRSLAPVAALLIIDQAERIHMRALKNARERGEDVLPHVRALVLVEDAKQKTMACGRSS